MRLRLMNLTNKLLHIQFVCFFRVCQSVTFFLLLTINSKNSGEKGMARASPERGIHNKTCT